MVPRLDGDIDLDEFEAEREQLHELTDYNQLDQLGGVEVTTLGREVTLATFVTYEEGYWNVYYDLANDEYTIFNPDRGQMCVSQDLEGIAEYVDDYIYGDNL